MVKATVSLLAVFLVLGGLCWRLTVGVDLSDEAYYAAFVDDWLKGGIRSSTFLVLHQTAALIVYPAVILYYHVNGSTDGLLLFLRCLFLLGNAFAAGMLFLFVRRLFGHYCALAAALAFVSFIPLTLPAPSYDTIGLQAMTVALAALGLAFLQEARAGAYWLAASAAAWGIAILAYPPLVAVAGFLCLLLLVLYPRQAGGWKYAALTGAAFCIALCIAVSAFSWAKLEDSFFYLSAFNNSGDFRRKLDFARAAFAYPGNQAMALMYIPALLLGVMRTFLAARFTAQLFALFFLVLQICFPPFPATLLLLSHDAITLAALCGMGLLADVRSADPQRRLVAVLYAASLFAGLVFVASATNGVFNFAMGAFPAALLAVSSTGYTHEARRFTCASLGFFALLIFITGISTYYGDDPRIPLTRQRVTWGAAKGLAVRSDQFAVINAMRDLVLPLMRPQDTILVLGGSPGLMLQTPARTKAYSIYPMYSPVATPKVLALTHDFYRNPVNRPDIVVIYRDLTFINPFGDDFTRWYAPLAQHQYPHGLFEVFRKREP